MFSKLGSKDWKLSGPDQTTSYGSAPPDMLVKIIPSSNSSHDVNSPVKLGTITSGDSNVNVSVKI